MAVQRGSNGVVKEQLRVAIVGGGLVGSLCACFFAKRGYDVSLYEYREDIRSCELVPGRSINLSMSTRARAALREVGLEDQMVNNHGIPMKARMVHRLDGSTYAIPYDVVHGQCIYSVGRKHLNEILLTAAEKYPTVRTVFRHKLVSADLHEGTMTFLRTATKEIVTEHADLIIGADGAYSSVRKEIMKQPQYNYSQKYIEHGYMELCIPATKDGDFAMPANYLHLWPRSTFMMIALPNQDQTWTVTLFMPFAQFAKLNTADKVLSFFEENFPDSIPLIGRERLVHDFFVTKPSHLVSVKCNPYHVANKAVLIGDAAHAMVPFFGQGMNAGFEDCLLLDRLMTKHKNNLSLVLPEFSAHRNPDAEAICDLAMYNYIEMRDLVNKKSFMMRKKLDNFLYQWFPRIWVPLYNSVTFTDMKYSQCIQNKRFQDKMISTCVAVTGIGMSILAYGITSFTETRYGYFSGIMDDIKSWLT